MLIELTQKEIQLLVDVCNDQIRFLQEVNETIGTKKIDDRIGKISAVQQKLCQDGDL